MADDDSPRSPTRRVFLRTIAAGASAATLPACPGRAPVPDAAMDAGTDASADTAVLSCDGGARFFSDDERAAIDRMGDYVLPADGPSPSASALGLANYIERLMTALEVPSGNPTVFAGGPFSDRNPYPAPLGGVPSTRYPDNDFARFLPLGRVQAIAWRLRLYGSDGIPGGGPNDAVTGPVVGLRTLVKNGLCRFLGLAAGRTIASLSDDDMGIIWPSLGSEFTDQMLQFVAESTWSAPEYGGNAAAAGWHAIHFEGDSQPLGFSLYDPMTMTYRDRPGAPDATANPGVDPDPFDNDVRNVVTMFTRFLGGRVRT